MKLMFAISEFHKNPRSHNMISIPTWEVVCVFVYSLCCVLAAASFLSPPPLVSPSSLVSVWRTSLLPITTEVLYFIFIQTGSRMKNIQLTVASDPGKAAQLWQLSAACWSVFSHHSCHTAMQDNGVWLPAVSLPYWSVNHSFTKW